MKILILTSTHPLRAAGIAANNLSDALSSFKENEVTIITREWKKNDDEKIIHIETNFIHYLNELKIVFFKIKKNLFKLIFNLITTPNKKEIVALKKEYCFEYDMNKTYYSTNKILKRANFKPDVIIVLFMNNFLSFKNLYELNKITEAKIFLYSLLIWTGIYALVRKCYKDKSLKNHIYVLS